MRFDERGRWLILGIIVAGGIAVRGWQLDGASVTHPEIYAPGIGFPEFATNPIQRDSVSDIVRSSLLTDNHPPGYYLLLLPWTQWFGTSLLALRLPSMILGALTVPLLFIAVRRVETSFVAFAAATWLALHGAHVLWSRHARMWVLCAAMAVVSVWALGVLRRRPSGGWAVLYVASLVIGLWAEFTFWPILAAQMLSEMLVQARSRTMPLTLGLQALSVALASPVFLFLFTRHHASGYLDAPLTEHVRQFVAFGSWFDLGMLIPYGLTGQVLATCLVICGACLIGIGAWKGPSCADAVVERPAPSGMEWGLWAMALWPAALIWFWRSMPVGEGIPVKTLTLLVPVTVAIAYGLAARNWTRLRRIVGPSVSRFPVQYVAQDLALVHAVVPFVILASASVVLPGLAPRSLLATVPFLLVVASRGLAHVAKAPAVRLAAIAFVVAGGIAGTHLYLTQPPTRDYQSLAASILSRSQPGDMLVVENGWWAQPLHYYIRPDVMPSRNIDILNDESALATLEAERLWIVAFGADPTTRIDDLSRMVAGFRAADLVTGLGAGAVLLVREP